MASLPPLKPIDHGSGFDRHILITGGAGFIASHVVILLCKKYSCCVKLNPPRRNVAATPSNS